MNVPARDSGFSFPFTGSPRLRAAASKIDGSHGVSVHGGSIERRDVDRGYDVLRRDASVSVSNRKRLRSLDGVDAGERALQGLVERDETAEQSWPQGSLRAASVSARERRVRAREG